MRDSPVQQDLRARLAQPVSVLVGQQGIQDHKESQAQQDHLVVMPISQVLPDRKETQAQPDHRVAMQISQVRQDRRVSQVRQVSGSPGQPETQGCKGRLAQQVPQAVMQDSQVRQDLRALQVLSELEPQDLLEIPDRKESQDLPALLAVMRDSLAPPDLKGRLATRVLQVTQDRRESPEIPVQLVIKELRGQQAHLVVMPISLVRLDHRD